MANYAIRARFKEREICGNRSRVPTSLASYVKAGRSACGTFQRPFRLARSSLHRGRMSACLAGTT
jgi:hypothetical protein